ncbi:hypothetical protein ACN38_g9234 [Penicillium nordicum]|uniref:Integral membrane protein n=1 Tax=Penicillium nordicum TaxID=229535 RepID=A0A0M8NVZ4_9EURO|nr:hypothetical protein ACN38_g9234 [Penicillium nordicum]
MRPITTHLALVATVTLFLASLATALPHGDEPMDMRMDMNAVTDTPQPETTMMQNNTAGPMSYFAYSKHSSPIIAHIALMVLGWCFVLPVAVMLSIARSRLAIPSQFLFLAFNALGVLLGFIYNNQTPDLYENNAHHKLGWVATVVAGVQVVLALLFTYAGRGESHTPSYQHNAFLPVAIDDHDNERVCLTDSMGERRWSRDSGQGTDSNSSSIHSPGSSCGSPTEYDGFEKPDELPARDAAQHGWIHRTGVGRLLSKTVPGLIPNRVLRVLNVVYNIVDRVILPFGFAAIASGAVTYGGIMRSRDVFNGLAHFIKGGIFFWYGILTLGRYIGCWADLGWAWNKKPSAAIVGWKAKVPSGEATESFVIFLYGASNVFLEHLSGAGKPWSARDLEHVSISILFFGGGLAGMLFESSCIRDWVNNTILQTPAHATSDEAWTPPRSQGISLNPMPALVIMLLGMMMGSHHQDSMTSTMVHKQWGNMLVGFALARGMTYVMLYLKPPTSYLPARPPTEIIAAFCLISGGLIFMLSTRNVIQSMEYYELDAMFTFTVGLGFSAFIMAYEVFVIAVKAWAVKRVQRSRPDFRFK